MRRWILSDVDRHARGYTHVWVILSGCALFAPLPFVDEFLARYALRRALSLDAPPERPLDEATLRTLTEDRSSMLVGCLTTAVWWPIKKLFKTVLWFLTLKDVLDRVAWSAQVLANVRVARAEGWLPEQARAVRDATEVAFGRHRWSPITRVLLRYERPVLDAAPEATFSGRFTQFLRRHAGGALMDRIFVERAREEVLAARSAALAQGVDGAAPGHADAER